MANNHLHKKLLLCTNITLSCMNLLQIGIPAKHIIKDGTESLQLPSHTHHFLFLCHANVKHHSQVASQPPPFIHWVTHSLLQLLTHPHSPQPPSTKAPASGPGGQLAAAPGPGPCSTATSGACSCTHSALRCTRCDQHPSGATRQQPAVKVRPQGGNLQCL